MTTARTTTLTGVLLEGLNFAGKSTTATRLTTLLRSRGTEVHSRHCHVCDTDSTHTLQRQAKASIGDSTHRPFPDPDLLRPFNATKSAQMLIDSELAADSPYTTGSHGPVLVQDRHWFTQYCNNAFFNPGEGYLSDTWARTRAPRFTLQVYLTCSPAERARRAGTREGDAHGLNAYLRAHPKGIAALDTFCIEQIVDDSSWTIVATDGRSQDDIAQQLLALFDARRDAVAA
ncbi:hypothetical protein [Streptomyces resistomycificus]|uniref:Thymidylate kinase n=1 Tax=Streptomyces resistomycificus TaxID=67356 RepID=A0A0L8L3B5_9ACTN|nr:hypothetical protein [Streptomyces resistomycificus]KOG32615.1 hypothetical protein ADK37_26470 [Streptomyces resistomycificus]KUN90554.1 hypothetical protein AQJ84_39565 [Streptomyces resistomycificus]